MLIQIMDKLAAKAFAPNETVLARGKEDDRIVIVLEGEPQLFINGKTTSVKQNSLLNGQVLFG